MLVASPSLKITMARFLRVTLTLSLRFNLGFGLWADLGGYRLITLLPSATCGRFLMLDVVGVTSASRGNGRAGYILMPGGQLQSAPRGDPAVLRPAGLAALPPEPALVADAVARSRDTRRCGSSVPRHSRRAPSPLPVASRCPLPRRDRSQPPSPPTVGVPVVLNCPGHGQVRLRGQQGCLRPAKSARADQHRGRGGARVLRATELRPCSSGPVH